jgi:hypothetical protein
MAFLEDRDVGDSLPFFEFSFDLVMRNLFDCVYRVFLPFWSSFCPFHLFIRGTDHVIFELLQCIKPGADNLSCLTFSTTSPFLSSRS